MHQGMAFGMNMLLETHGCTARIRIGKDQPEERRRGGTQGGVLHQRQRQRERERERERENARSGNKSSDHVSVRGDFR